MANKKAISAFVFDEPAFTTRFPDLINPVSKDNLGGKSIRECFGFENDCFVPTREDWEHVWKECCDAEISIIKESARNQIREESFERRASNEYKRKCAYLDHVKRYSDAPLKVYRDGDLKIGSFRIIEGSRKVAPMVVEVPELYFTRIKPIEAIEAPKIVKITWRGSKEPLYLVGDRVNPYNMSKTLEPHVEIHASRRNRSEVTNALFSFLMRESRGREERLHRHRGFVPDGRGGYIFVSGINELTIEEVIKRG